MLAHPEQASLTPPRHFTLNIEDGEIKITSGFLNWVNGHFNPPTLVCVLGIGHMLGIVNKWGIVTQDQVRAVVKVEPPSLLARAAVFTGKSL